MSADAAKSMEDFATSLGVSARDLATATSLAVRLHQIAVEVAEGMQRAGLADRPADVVEMAFRMTTEGCGERRGQTTKCPNPKCGVTFTVPETQQAVARLDVWT